MAVCSQVPSISRRVIIGCVSIASVLFLTPAFANAAGLYFSPASRSVYSGSNFTVSVYASSPAEAMNAVSGIIDFPADKLEVLSLSKTNSIVGFWVVDPSYSNRTAEENIHFEGVILNPGYTGTSGKIISITFRARNSGSAAVKFISSAILANDGKGTNILDSIDSARFTITAAPQAPEIRNDKVPAAPVVSSATHPDSAKWYSQKKLELAWTLPNDIDDVDYALTINPNFTFSDQQKGKGTISSVSYDLTGYADGVWNFYMRFHNSFGWGAVLKREIRVDFTPPAPFTIEQKSGDSTNPTPQFNWNSSDTSSGIQGYQVKIGDGAWFDASTIFANDYYVLPLQTPTGDRKLSVRAYDRAGNFTDESASFVVSPLESPVITNYSQKISSPQESVIVNGTSLPNYKINLTLTKDQTVITFIALADSAGHWTAAYKDQLENGNWDLQAQAVDDRGALSNMTPGVPVAVSGWFGKTFQAFAQWGLLALGIISLIAIFAGIGYFVIYRLIMWRTRLRKELWQFKDELRQDLEKLEKELELQAAHKLEIPAVQKHLEDELSHLEKDVEGEIKKIEGFEDPKGQQPKNSA